MYIGQERPQSGTTRRKYILRGLLGSPARLRQYAHDANRSIRVKQWEPIVSDKRGKFFIGGKWVAPSSDQVIPVTEAATGLPLGNVPEANAQDVDQAVKAAHATTREWAATSPDFRADLMERFADAVLARAKEISEMVSRENGMPLALSLSANVESMSGSLRYYAGLARSGYADETRQAISYQGTLLMQHEQVGVVLWSDRRKQNTGMLARTMSATRRRLLGAQSWACSQTRRHRVTVSTGLRQHTRQASLLG
jgi:hypothetical protein